MKSKDAVLVQGKKPVDRKLFLLIGLVLLTAFVILYQATSGPAPRITVAPTQPQPAQQRITRSLPSKSHQAKVTNPLYTEDPDLLPQLQKETPTFENEKRSLFAFLMKPQPLPKSVCGDGKCNDNETHESCSDCPAPPVAPVCGDEKCNGSETYQSCLSDCHPPDITLKYIGYIKDFLGDVAFLTDGKDVYMGRADDIIANRYRVVKITEQGVELSSINLNSAYSETISFFGSRS